MVLLPTPPFALLTAMTLATFPMGFFSGSPDQRAWLDRIHHADVIVSHLSSCVQQDSEGFLIWEAPIWKIYIRLLKVTACFD